MILDHEDEQSSAQVSMLEADPSAVRGVDPQVEVDRASNTGSRLSSHRDLYHQGRLRSLSEACHAIASPCRDMLIITPRCLGYQRTSPDIHEPELRGGETMKATLCHRHVAQCQTLTHSEDHISHQRHDILLEYQDAMTIPHCKTPSRVQDKRITPREQGRSGPHISLQVREHHQVKQKHSDSLATDS